jgi:hypothetical protein
MHILTQHMKGGIIDVCSNFYGPHVECAFIISWYEIYIYEMVILHPPIPPSHFTL